jgi:MFS family permease
MPHTALRDSLDLLRTRRFGTFWFASLLSSIGTWAQQVAQPWLLLSLGASPFLVGLDAFALSAPVWALTLLGGQLADRADRRRVIWVFQSIQMLCPTLIVILLLFGTIQPWMIICLSVIVGVTDALSMPSFSSIVPTIVRHDQIAAGVALNSTQFNISRIAGPAIAGVLIATIGPSGCFGLSALSYIPFIGVALWILPARASAVPLRGAFDVRHSFTGLRAVASVPYLRGALVTAFASGLLCGPLITFVPVLVKSAFGGSAQEFSVAVSAFGVGGVLGAFGLLGLGNRRDRRPLATWFAIAHGLVVVAVSLDPWSAVLPALLVGAGVAMSVTNTSTNALVQGAASPQLLGQAVSVYMLAMRGGIALGGFTTGLTVTALGVRDALLLNGVIAIIAQVLIGRTWSRAAVPVDALPPPAVAAVGAN